MKVSFAIITDNRDPDRLNQELASIQRLNIDYYDIFIAIDQDHSGRLGKLRNYAISQTKNEIVVVADDDLIFHPDFYDGLLRYGYDFDVLSCKIQNPDGSRFWDWKAHTDHDYLLDYNATSPHVSLTGGMMIIQRQVWQRVKWNENLGFYQGEDVDYTNRLKAAGMRIGFNPYCTVTHDDRRYTQAGQFVLRREYG